MISKDRPNNQGVAIGSLERVEKGTITLRLSEAVYRQDVLELTTKNGEAVEITSSKDGTPGQHLTLNCPKTKLLQKEQIVYRTKCPKILQHVQDDYINSYKKLPISVSVTARIGAPLTAIVTCELDNQTYTATCTDMLVEKSKQGETTIETVKKPLAQLGNTEYELASFTCNLDTCAFLPNGVLKKLRRALLAALEAEIAKAHTRVAGKQLSWDTVYESMITKSPANASDTQSSKQEQMIFSAVTQEQLRIILEELPHVESPVTGITMPLALYNQCRNMIPDSIRLYAELPPVIHDRFCVDLQESGIRGIYIRNIDALAILASQKLPEDCVILCDASLYCYNRLAHAFIRRFFADTDISFLTPRELKLEELDALAGEPLCLTLYEYQPVMLTANCLQKTKYGCKKEPVTLTVTDEMGNRFFARTNCDDCYNIIYNKVPYSILDKYKEPAFSRLHPRGYLVRFTIENEQQVRRILQILSGKSYDPMKNRRTFISRCIVMINIICEVSKYLVLLFMVLYTVKCFSVLSSKNEEQKRKKLNKQIGYVFVIHFLCYLILYLRLGQLKILIFYVAQIFVAILYMVLYHSIYKDSSRLLTNNASFLLLIGYIMLTRLNFNLAVKQFIFATVGLIITAFIPYIMLKWKKMKDCGVLYGVIGLLFLLTVFIPGLGSEKYGSRNWINLGHLSVQPMEFVKILFVFFVASMLVKASTFKELFVNALISAAFMGVLVLEKDLGAAVIFYITYV